MVVKKREINHFFFLCSPVPNYLQTGTRLMLGYHWSKSDTRLQFSLYIFLGLIVLQRSLRLPWGLTELQFSRNARWNILLIQDEWLVPVEGCAPSRCVCQPWAGSASYAEVCQWVWCEQTCTDRPAESLAVMLHHVGLYLLMGLLLLDFYRSHVQGQRQQKGTQVLDRSNACTQPGNTLFFFFHLRFASCISGIYHFKIYYRTFKAQGWMCCRLQLWI